MIELQTVTQTIELGTLPIITVNQNTLGYTPEDIAHKNQSNGYCGLDGGGKVPIGNLPTTLLQYQGVWDASSNTPTLANPDPSKIGSVYNVAVAGSLFGIDWSLGDWLIYNASGVPEKSDNSDDVTSVNGQTGSVVLNKSHIGLGNVVNLDTSNTANITDSTNKRFVTDSEKTKLSNTSGTNTGDQDLSGKQDVLISGTNIKNINGSSVLGSGNLVIPTIVHALIFG